MDFFGTIITNFLDEIVTRIAALISGILLGFIDPFLPAAE